MALVSGFRTHLIAAETFRAHAEKERINGQRACRRARAREREMQTELKQRWTEQRWTEQQWTERAVVGTPKLA